jgi:predicted CXXCH cytochrome family protein
VEQFAQSTCKRVSGEKMSCTNCHDPHFTPDAQQRTAFYRGKCLACHSEPQFAVSHHPENQDCTSCHMTRSGAQNIPHVAWTDHRILKLPASVKTEPRTQAQEQLAPIFSPGATKRDLAMAYYLKMLEGDRTAGPRAWEQLNQEKDEIRDDPAALDALGVMEAENGDGKNAEQIFRRVLELSPHDLTAISDLGTLLAKQGKLQEAASLLQAAFDRNRNISGLAMNLARVQCMTGDAKSAHSTLETTLVYNPDLESVRRLMKELSSCGKADGGQ